MRAGGIRMNRFLRNFGSAVGGSAGMAPSAGEVSCLVGRETSACAPPLGGVAGAAAAGPALDVTAAKTAISTPARAFVVIAHSLSVRP
jgi:hypothetical protein